jgi:hypothetical protein
MNTPYSKERDELARLLPAPVERDLPSDRQHRLQEFVMSQIQQESRPRAHRAARWRPASGWRVVPPTAVVAAVALVAIGAGKLGPGNPAPTANGPGPVVASHPPRTTLELAAENAEARPFTPPRPDQWIYVRDRSTYTGSIAREKGMAPVGTGQIWSRADGRQTAMTQGDERVQALNGPNDYPMLASLPTDPRALLAALRAHITRQLGLRGPNTEEGWNVALHGTIVRALDAYLLPPRVTGAMWRALALIPGVRQESGTSTVAGHQVITVSRVNEGWDSVQILLDATTHDYVGERSVAAVTHTFDMGGGRRLTVPKGEVQYTITRLAAAIVDAAGQTR